MSPQCNEKPRAAAKRMPWKMPPDDHSADGMKQAHFSKDHSRVSELKYAATNTAGEFQ